MLNQLLIGGSTAAYASSTSSATTLTATNPSDVRDGALAIFRSDNSLLVAGQTIGDSESIYFVQGVPTGRRPIVTPLIKGREILNWKGLSYTAPVRQVSYVGWTGSGSNTISLTNSGIYTLTVVDLTRQYEPFPRFPYQILADASATAWEIADALAAKINVYATYAYYQSPIGLQVPQYNSAVTANVIVNVSSSAIGGSETLTVTNGSATVTSSGTSHALVAGDYVRIGHATTTTYPVYKVSSVNGATITLTRPFIGTSASGVAAGELSAAPTSSDAAGIKLTSKDDGVYFSVALIDDFDETPITNSTPYLPGSGTYTGVSTLEKRTAGYNGNLNRVILPISNYEYAVSGTTYDLYYIGYRNVFESKDTIGAYSSASMQLTIAMPVSATQQTAFEGVINPYMNSLNFTNVNL